MSHLWPTSAFLLTLALPLAAQQGPKVPVPEPDPGPRKPIQNATPKRPAKEKGEVCPLDGDSFTNRLGMTLVKIPAGTFQMGSDRGGADEKPVHQVTITRAFWMGKYPVTQGQWKSVMGGNPSANRDAGSDAPVEWVDWRQVQGFIAKLNGRQSQLHYRLPTEAEWEYACRAGTTGDTFGPLDGIAWHRGNSGNSTHPVGQKQPNAFGLYDMQGNVRQWCQDGYGRYSGDSQVDPTGAPDRDYEVVVRGSSFSGRVASAAARNSTTPILRKRDLGFRLVAVARP